MYLYEFDILMEFKNYFPHNNITVVCKTKKDIKKIMSKKIKTMSVYKKALNRNLMKRKSKFNEEIISD